MRSRPPLVAVLLLVAACGGSATQDHQSEWRDVLHHKQAAASPNATAREKQVYADSLSAFLRRHPNHSRAREVYQRVQMEFAEELMSFGRYQDALRFYRAVLASDPDNGRAHAGVSAAMSRLAVTRPQLLELEVGWTEKQVVAALGRPIPGWSVRTRRSGSTVQAWYYRTTTGALAGVYFRDGRVIAAEESSQARLGL
jgi:tetratricopeptide (TPR) repeat protein